MRYLWLKLPWVPFGFTSQAIMRWLIISRKRKEDASRRHVLHEEQHLRDMRRWPVVWPVVWLVEAIISRSWYDNHPWEIRAHNASKEGT